MIEIWAVILSAGLGAIGALALMWLGVKFASRSDVTALRSELELLKQSFDHVAADQEAHKQHADDLQLVKIDVAVLKDRTASTEKLVRLVARQNTLIWRRMGGQVTPKLAPEAKRVAPTTPPN